MSRATARQVGIIALVVALFLPASLLLRSFGAGAAFSVLSSALALLVFRLLWSAAHGLPGSGLLRGGFFCGLAGWAMTFLLPLVDDLLGLNPWLATLLWTAALLLVAVGLLRLHWVPPWVASLCGVWGLLVAARTVAVLSAWQLTPGTETAVVVAPVVAGVLFWAAFGAALLVASKGPDEPRRFAS